MRQLRAAQLATVGVGLYVAVLKQWLSVCVAQEAQQK